MIPRIKATNNNNTYTPAIYHTNNEGEREKWHKSSDMPIGFSDASSQNDKDEKETVGGGMNERTNQMPERCDELNSCN